MASINIAVGYQKAWTVRKFTGNNIIYLISVFAIGGVIGVGIGLMVAPYSGKVVRKKLREAGVGTYEDVNRTLEDMSVLAKKSVQNLKIELEPQI